MNYENGNESDIFLKIMFFAQTVYICSNLLKKDFFLNKIIFYGCID